MNVEDLQHLVIIEACIFIAIVSIIVSCFQRWQYSLYISTLAAFAGFFYAWNALLALGSCMVFGPTALLLWFDLEEKSSTKYLTPQANTLRMISWSSLYIGISTIIYYNVARIISFLS